MEIKSFSKCTHAIFPTSTDFFFSLARGFTRGLIFQIFVKGLSSHPPGKLTLVAALLIVRILSSFAQHTPYKSCNSTKSGVALKLSTTLVITCCGSTLRVLLQQRSSVVHWGVPPSLNDRAVERVNQRKVDLPRDSLS